MNKINVCLAQISTKLGDVESNAKKHIEIINENNADVICFPELSLTGYMIKDISFEIYDKCLKAIENIKRKIKKDQLVIVGSVIKNELKTINNGAFVIKGNEIVGNAKKFYLPTYGLFEEMRYFTPASPLKDLKVFEFRGINFGIVICEDAWHYEPVEALSRMGAQIIFCLSSSPIRGVNKAKKGKLLIEDQWEALIKAHSIINGIYFAFVNRVGPEDEEFFWGGSMVSSPKGKIIAKCKKYDEDVINVTIDVSEVEKARRFSSFKIHQNNFHEILSKL